MRRLRFDELLRELLGTDGDGEILTRWRARTAEALGSWEHPACSTVWERLALIYGEAGTAALRAPAEAPQQQLLGFSGDDLARLLEATKDGRERVAAIRAAAAPAH